jgi:hypothetical protein
MERCLNLAVTGGIDDVVVPAVEEVSYASTSTSMTTDSDSGGRERFEPVIVDDDVGDVAAVEVGGCEGMEGIEDEIVVVPLTGVAPSTVVDFGSVWVKVTLVDAFPFATICRRTVFFLKAGTDEPPAAKKSKSLPSFPFPWFFLLLPSSLSLLLLFSEGDDAVVIAAFVDEAGAQGRVTIAFTGVLLVDAANLEDDDDEGDEDEPAPYVKGLRR